MKNSIKQVLVIIFLTIVHALHSNAQTTQISGKIIDKSNGEGLVGAAVLIDKTTTGVVTDVEGNFVLTVAPGTYTLVILTTPKIFSINKASENT